MLSTCSLFTHFLLFTRQTYLAVFLWGFFTFLEILAYCVVEGRTPTKIFRPCTIPELSWLFDMSSKFLTTEPWVCCCYQKNICTTWRRTTGARRKKNPQHHTSLCQETFAPWISKSQRSVGIIWKGWQFSSDDSAMQSTVRIYSVCQIIVVTYLA